MESNHLNFLTARGPTSQNKIVNLINRKVLQLVSEINLTRSAYIWIYEILATPARTKIKTRLDTNIGWFI